MILLVIGFGFLVVGFALFIMALVQRRAERKGVRINKLREQIKIVEDYNAWKLKAEKTIKSIIK